MRFIFVHILKIFVKSQNVPKRDRGIAANDIKWTMTQIDYLLNDTKALLADQGQS